MAHVCQPDGEATSLDCPCEEISGSTIGHGDSMLAGVELCGVLGWLFGIDASETVGCEGGAMTTGCGACDDNGASKGFLIVNKCWGST